MIPSNYKANRRVRNDPYYYEVSEINPLGAQPLEDRIREVLPHFTRTLPEIEGFLPQIAKRNVLFIDVETSGTARYNQIVTAVIARLNGDIHLQAYAALNPMQERGLLRALAPELANSTYIITHGGQSFDVPVLEKRYAAHGLGKEIRHHRKKTTLEARHVDILRFARTTLRTPDNKLQTIEKLHLGYTRKGDIPSASIPDRYARFLEGNADHELTEILKHNARDTLATMALFCYLATRR